MDRKELRLMIIEALDEISCEMEEGSCMDEEELDEFSGGAGAGAGNTTANITGYTGPLGARPPGPRRNIVNVTQRAFGGIPKKRKKR
jgi:hypothetical protein